MLDSCFRGHLLLCSHFVVEEEAWLRFTSSSFKSNFALRPVHALGGQLFDWENHETHLLLQVVRLRTKRYI
jgi:hypothetical protein